MNQISLQLGATLRGGTYRIDRVLGQGGFGITYLATDLSLDKRVAIKEFFPKDYCDRNSSTSHVTLGTQSTAQFVERLKAKFLKEAKNIARFDHPNIIKIHAAFEENNTAYYVMDFIEGQSLSERVKNQGPLPLATALGYVAKIGAALDYVHSLHMNHLDVKPANIMVRRADNCPILIDFGLSKQYDTSGHQTSSTPVGISHGFAPMEQYNDGGVSEFSPTTDEYSLAATLYYLLSGVVPPQATKLVEEGLTFPQSVPTGLIAPITKAMSPGRPQRYPSVRQFLSAIASPDTSYDPPKPTPRPRPIPQPQPAPQPRPYPAPDPAPRNMITRYVIIGVVVVAAIALFIARPWHSEADEPTLADTVVEAPIKVLDLMSNAAPPTDSVNNMFFQHKLGSCSYTGQVDDNNKPDGTGKATWTSGDAISYNGEWSHGKMNGQATYMLRNGDKFVGTFVNDYYSRGSYTTKSGYRFEGTFKNAQPDKGT